MKTILLAVLFTTTFLKVFCQKDDPQVKAINDRVLSLEYNMEVQTKASIDSSKAANNPYKVTFYKNKLDGTLAKLEEVILKPDVKITCYFSRQALIKAICIDKSTSSTLTLESYFRNDKLIYTTHRNVDGDNSQSGLIQHAKYYLEKYQLIMLQH